MIGDGIRMLLTDEAMEAMFEASHRDNGRKEIFRESAKAQLREVVEELRKRAEVEHEHCDNSCSHRGVSIWFDIYDWQSLLEEVA